MNQIRLRDHRVYLNRLDTELLWSVDEGSIDTEVNVKRVGIDGLSYTKQNLSEDNIKEPKAWIEVPNSSLRVYKDTAHLCCYRDFD